MKKLYEVEITSLAYVWAEDGEEARRLMKNTISEDHIVSSFAFEVLPNARLSPDWSTCTPLGEPPEGFENLSLQEIQKQRFFVYKFLRQAGMTAAKLFASVKDTEPDGK